MDRAAKLLRQYKYAARCLSPEQLVAAAWPDAVGKTIGAHSKVEKLWNGRLTVAVDDEVWRAQLTTLSGQIIRLLGKALGEDLVTQVEFRTGIRKRRPARAETSEQDASRVGDDGIADPILSRIYRSSKKKESA
jgi:predicted nucleic acid-binding Zn ribbon protein